MADLTEVREIASQVAAKHIDDIAKAVEVAEKRIRALPNYEDVVMYLIRNCVQELIYDARHTANVEMKRQTGYYGGPAKVTGVSKEIEDCYRSVYAYCIAGRSLGTIRGEDLAGIAERERLVATGHVFNAQLCEELSGLVKPDQTVKDAVPEKKLRMIFKRLNKGDNLAA